ncbi:MAG: prohibitin family protein [Burkholderiales bacterium]|nr:prohibitin family protein [Phycisphaerae bacterium]
MPPSLPSRSPNGPSPSAVGLIIFAILVVVVLIGSFYVVEPGTRGVKVTLGRVHEGFLPEGFGMKMPFITKVHDVMVRQQTRESNAECYSQDLQQVTIKVKIIYAVPEASVVSIFKEYYGDPFDSLIVPRIQEALKEQTALMSAEQIVKQREVIKTKAIESARLKVGTIATIKDLVLENIALSKQLEDAIELKMVQEQNASKARFEQERRKIDADTKVIEAKAEAEAISIRGEALRKNPDQITLQIVEKWDGRAPLVLGGNVSGEGGNGANIILPLPVQRSQQQKE